MSLLPWTLVPHCPASLLRPDLSGEVSPAPGSRPLPDPVQALDVNGQLWAPRDLCTHHWQAGVGSRRPCPTYQGSQESEGERAGSRGVARPRGGALTTPETTGRVAAQNMLAQEAEISTVPYLWTSMFGKSLRYAGTQGPR